MRTYQITILSAVFKFLILSLFFSFSCLAQYFDLESFSRELSIRQERVEEFVFLKNSANKLGIKNLYMFGGTAAAWAHYVRWDMRRELGVDQLQPHRFDYDYMNIFRSSQDFDVVIDGTKEQADLLEKLIQNKFNYFSGIRPTWEVRLLNDQKADKESIMGFDFQNQHTDSHSTGLIEMLECESFNCVKDVRDLSSSHNQFLVDVFEAKLHYYFSEKHNSTNRFKQGMNPPILSVIRYLTKAVQYELRIRDEDRKVIQGIIDNFKVSDKNKWSSYVTKWLEKNAKKLIINAIDMEFATKLLKTIKLKEKLIKIGDKERKDSMSWWLNKKALGSKPVGKGRGKKASELFKANRNGNIIISHETNSFAAFESLTKAHDGEANVLISRTNISGEAAVYGEGHYTLIGREGGRGTGITIRYILDPGAREGHDFMHSGQIVILKNKSAVKVVYEDINLSVVEYFKQISSGLSFDKNDKGVLEKIKRRIKRKASRLTKAQTLKIKKIVNKELKTIINPIWDGGTNSSVNFAVLKEWMLIPESVNDINIIESIIDIAETDFLQEIINDHLIASHWRESKHSKQIIETILYNHNGISVNNSNILKSLDLTGEGAADFIRWLEEGGEISYKARKEWLQFLHLSKPIITKKYQISFKEIFFELLDDVLRYSEPIRSYGTHYHDYQKPWQALGIMYNLVSLYTNVDDKIISAFKAADDPNLSLAMSFLISTPHGLESDKLIKYFMRIPNFSERNFIVRTINSWDTNYEGNNLETFINKHYKEMLDQPGWADSFARYALSRDKVIEMKSYPKWVDYYLKKGNSVEVLFNLSISNHLTYVNHPSMIDKWMTQYVKNHVVDSKTIQHFLKSNLLDYNTEQFDKWLNYFIDNGVHSSAIARFVLSSDHIMNGYKNYEEVILKFIQKGRHVSYLNKYVFKKINNRYSGKFFNHRNITLSYLKKLLEQKDCSKHFELKG